SRGWTWPACAATASSSPRPPARRPTRSRPAALWSPPGFKGMIAVPLAPHTLRSRAVVTDASDVIEVGFDDTDEFREATLFVDGDIVPFDAPLRKIYVQCAPFDVTLLRADGASFYERISTDFFGE
ncbi:MAG: hypothetical protein U0N05_07370, partial [Adlercreutzia sp.]